MSNQEQHQINDHHGAHAESKPIIQFGSGIVFPILIIALFLAAVSFVRSMNSDHGETHATEHTTTPAHNHSH